MVKITEGLGENKPFSHNELFESGYIRQYGKDATATAFLLGGIGTGNVSLGSRGEFRDWEIFNHPGKGATLPNTYFSIWAQAEGKEPVARILESKINPPHTHAHGYSPGTAAGLPRLENSKLVGKYPFVRVVFEDNSLPVDVELEAFTPFIPLNPMDSGIPGAYLTYKVKNTSNVPVEVTIAGSIINPIGATFDQKGNLQTQKCSQNWNQFIEEEDFSGLFLRSYKFPEVHREFGNIALTTTNKKTTYKRSWLRGPWFDHLHEFWDDFSKNGLFTDLEYTSPSKDGSTDTGTLGVRESILPGEIKEFSFFLTWYFPNRLNGWSDAFSVKEKGRETVENYYTNHFDSAWSVAEYMVKNRKRLIQQSRTFEDALFSSSLPSYVIDAIASNITVLRSTTCFWLKDGRFLGYEGCHDDWGCCDGNCTHVWNYAQTLAFLFPTLEQNMRETEFLEEVDQDGKMNFRAVQMFDCEWTFGENPAEAAADGQMGAIMRVYREWKLSGDDTFLKKLWPAMKNALKYALLQWDTDEDLVLDGKQHNTYDIEFYGPNPLTGVFFLGALRVAEEVASYFGESDNASMYREVFEKSSKRLDELLWNGEYYIQLLDDVNQHKYQHGTGCLSDQLLGQQLAHLFDLGYLLPEDHVKKAVYSIYKHNFKTDFSDHANPQRTYVLNDEKGLLLCSWPNGDRPTFPFVYSDEVWTGIEYQVATHLIYEGFITEGLSIVKAVRERHDGIRRNPWNEVECGHHYARAMASWGLLIALSGFSFDMTKNELSFKPRINEEDFSTFWSTGKAWGTFQQKKNTDTGEWEVSIDVLYGDVTGLTVHACDKNWEVVSAAR
ncbi:MAG TPA: GH116 family glycosyl-hydrolase [Bacillaceae bacterium]|nr:GH116 family glycosyl-hydrolase [Bacillaceae bacterium]